MHAYDPITQEARYWQPTTSKTAKSKTRPTNTKDIREQSLVPSVTEIIKILDKPNLRDWIIREAATALMSSPRRENEGPDAFIERVLFTDKEHEDERNRAADAGEKLHEYILSSVMSWQSTGANFESVHPVVRAILKLGRPVESEKILINKELGYGGRTDLITEDDMCIGVLDIKTVKTLPKSEPWSEAKLQVGAYLGALGNTGDKIKVGHVCYVLRSDPTIFSILPVVDWQREFRKFSLLLKYWQIANEIPETEALPIPF